MSKWFWGKMEVEGKDVKVCWRRDEKGGLWVRMLFDEKYEFKGKVVFSGMKGDEDESEVKVVGGHDE